MEKQVGPNTNFHLFLYQRIASLYLIQRQLPQVEETYQKCIEVAEKAKTPFSKEADQTQSVFMWQNNLLKFYMEHDVMKAVNYGHELLDEVGEILPKAESSDLSFSLGTSYALKGDPVEIPTSLDFLK